MSEETSTENAAELIGQLRDEFQQTATDTFDQVAAEKLEQISEGQSQDQSHGMKI